MTETVTDAMKDDLIKIVGSLALLAVALPWLSWPAWVLWGWFAVPLGAPEVPFVHMIGLMVLLMAFKGSTKPQKNDDRDWEQTIANFVLIPPITVGIGWIVKAFM